MKKVKNRKNFLFFLNFFLFNLFNNKPSDDITIRKLQNTLYPISIVLLKTPIILGSSFIIKKLNKKFKWNQNPSFNKYINIASLALLSFEVIKGASWSIKREYNYKKRIKLFENNKPKRIELKTNSELPILSTKDRSKILFAHGSGFRGFPEQLKTVNISQEKKYCLYLWSGNIGGNYFENDGALLGKKILMDIQENKKTYNTFIGHSNGGNVIYQTIKEIHKAYINPKNTDEFKKKIKDYLDNITIYNLFSPSSKEAVNEILNILKKYKSKLRIISLKFDFLQDSDPIAHSKLTIPHVIFPLTNQPNITRDTMFIEELEKLSKKDNSLKNIDFCQIYIDNENKNLIHHNNPDYLLEKEVENKIFLDYIEEQIKKNESKKLFFKPIDMTISITNN